MSLIWRMSKEVIDLGDVCCEHCPQKNEWILLNGNPLNNIQMQNLYLFLEEEEEEREIRFYSYLRKTIDELIYN